jgi:hypothetical protein
MHNKRFFFVKLGILLGMEICCCALVSDSAVLRAHSYSTVSAEIDFVVPLQQVALFIGRNHSVFLSMARCYPQPIGTW